MKNKKTTIVIKGKTNTRYNIFYKLVATIVLIVIFIILLTNLIINKVTNNKFAQEANEFSKMNATTVFSIDKIYMYSSASATSNQDTRPIWNLDVSQYTDIALYINNRPLEGQNYENSIKEMYISNVKFVGPEVGTPTIYYKNINNFGKINSTEDYKIEDKLEYDVIKEGDVDYSKPQIFSNCQNPITLEYINKDIKQNTIISDISSEIKFDGSILRRTGVILDTISSTLSFKITIINYYNQEFVTNVYIDIPLRDTVNNATIYNSNIVKKLESTNLIKFFRIK